MSKYNIQTLENLNKRANTFLTNRKNLKIYLQDFLGDFLVSYNVTKDSTSLNTILKSLKQDNSFMVYQINKWIQQVSNYKIVLNDKQNFILKSTNATKEFTPNEQFETTCFYDIEKPEKPNNGEEGYKNYDSIEKSLNKIFDKISLTDLSNLDKENLKKYINNKINSL